MFTVHSLRHSHLIHYVIDRGLPLPIVQKQVGHRSLKTTSVYLSASTEKMAEAYQTARQRAGGEVGKPQPSKYHITQQASNLTRLD